MHASRLIALGTPDELKRLRWAEEELLEVECSSPIEAVDIVAKVPGVRDAALYGMLLHVGVDSAASVAPCLTAALSERGIAVQRIERIIPSLEDVFVSLIAAQGQEAKQN
jgi:ABC-2 type transport system ATP-binding protein